MTEALDPRDRQHPAASPRTGPAEIIGHRGSPREAPENTLASFERALALGEEQMTWLVQESAMPRDQLMAGLCAALPELVDHLTPDGREPAEGENPWK